MTRGHIATLAACAGAALAAAAPAQTVYTDTFDDAVNLGIWGFGFDDEYPSFDGNPGWHLRNRTLDTAIPFLFSGRNIVTPFTGDYRARNVTEIALDVRVFNVPNLDARPLTIFLGRDNGTPDDYSDDDLVFTVSAARYTGASGWTRLVFPIPSQHAGPGLPAGWRGGSGEGWDLGLRDGVTWTDVITDVDFVDFYWHDPDFGGIFRVWDLGADNIGITYTTPNPAGGACCAGAACAFVADAASCAGAYLGDGVPCNGDAANPITCCPANFDRSGGVQVADIFAFLRAWFAGEPGADFDGAEGIQVADIFAFLRSWFAGC